MVTNLEINNNIVGIVLGCKKNYTPQNVQNIALDGTVYFQQTGTATEKRIISFFCDTPGKRNAVDIGINNGSILTVHWKNQVIKGFSEKEATWKEWPDGHGVGKITLLVTEVNSE